MGWGGPYWTPKVILGWGGSPPHELQCEVASLVEQNATLGGEGLRMARDEARAAGAEAASARNEAAIAKDWCQSNGSIF